MPSRDSSVDTFFNSKSGIGKFFNSFIVFWIIITVIILPLYFLYPTGNPNFEKILVIEKIAVTIFLIEYVFCFWTKKGGVSYIFSWESLIDLLSIVPLFLYSFGILSFFPSPLLLLRILKILKFVKVPEINESKLVQRYGAFQALPDERLQKIVQKHNIVFVISILLPLFFISMGVFILFFSEFNIISIIITFILFILGGILYIKTWINYRYDVIILTNRRVVIQNKDVFGGTSNDVRYESISDIIPNTSGFIKWLLGFGTLIIKTPTDLDDIHFRFVPHLNEVLYIINHNRQKAFDITTNKKKKKTDESFEEEESSENSPFEKQGSQK